MFVFFRMVYMMDPCLTIIHTNTHGFYSRTVWVCTHWRQGLGTFNDSKEISVVSPSCVEYFWTAKDRPSIYRVDIIWLFALWSQCHFLFYKHRVMCQLARTCANATYHTVYHGIHWIQPNITYLIVLSAIGRYSWTINNAMSALSAVRMGHRSDIFTVIVSLTEPDPMENPCGYRNLHFQIDVCFGL